MGDPGMKPPLVVSYGGGVNSTAMLVGFHERGQRPDLILFSDTGGEKPETYSHMKVVDEWLASIGWPKITVVSVADNPNAVAKTLEESCLSLGFLPSIVYGFKKCSQRWKADPQRRFLNKWQMYIDAKKAGASVTQAIGYDAGEVHRSLVGEDYVTFSFPLREWNWGRKECVEAITRAGLPVPVKSACFFCPSSKKGEILKLRREHPNLFDRAVAMERNAQSNNTSVKGLGRHWSWESLANADDAQLKMFNEVIETPCGCFDGESDEEEVCSL
jgi:hypothetical protein